MNNLSKIIFLFLFSTTVFAQDVCNLTAGVEKGGFTFDGPSTVCIGQTVKLKDNSGGTGVRYIFGYTGQSASQLSSISSQTNLDYTFLAAGRYTILQYGKKNGKDMYYCDVVYVRENSQPKFSYYSCNNTTVNISIPDDAIVNDFDYYLVDWGDSNPPENVPKTAIPFNKSRNLSLPRSIKVEGFYNGGNTCASPSRVTIPVLNISAFPSGFEQPFYPNIKKLELTNAQTASLDIEGSFDGSGYSLFMTKQGQNYPSTPILENVKPGNLTVNIPDTASSYCFYIQKPIACGVEQSAEICTIVINNAQATEKQNTVVWGEYPTAMTGILNEPAYGRVLNRTQSILKKENGVLLPQISGDSRGGNFTESIDCKKKYCYQIVAETRGQIYYNSFAGLSYSKEVCIDRKEVKPNPITATIASVKENNQVEIILSDDSPWTLKREKYYLYRVEENNKITPIDSSTTIKNFNDITVDASQQSFCYKVGFLDECGSVSTPSPDACTVNLSDANATTLKWTLDSPFGNRIINSFEVQSYDEQTDIPSTESTKTSTENTYIVPLDDFEIEAKYRIRILTADGKESFSNIFSIPIAVKLFLADAFSPNEDSLNDELEIKGATRRITTFSMIIFNKWGNPVFTTDDPQKGWNGNYQSQKAPTDTYTYKIYAKLDDGKELSKAGKFLLLR